MIKNINLRKIIVYLVLLTGIILSVVTYFYTKEQVVDHWKNNHQTKLELGLSKAEKQFYFDIINLKSQINENPKNDKSISKNHFLQWGTVSVPTKSQKKSYNLTLKDFKGNKTKLVLTKKQAKDIIDKTSEFGYVLFSLDKANLYAGFVEKSKGKSKSKTLFITRLKPIFKDVLKYNGFNIKVVDSSGKSLYEKSKESQLDNLKISKEYKSANATFYIDVFVDYDGLHGVGSYSTMFMILILFFTFAIVAYLFVQNVTLSNFNTKVSIQSAKLRSAYDMFRKIAGNSFDMIAITDENLKIEYVNSAYYKVLGYKTKQLLGFELEDIVADKFKDSIVYHAKRLTRDVRIVSFEFEMKHSNKRKNVVVQAMLEAFFDSEDCLTGYALHCKDVTSKRESLKALLKSKRRFKDFADSSADWLWETDENLRFTFVSSGVFASTGLTSDRLVGKKARFLFQSNLLIDKLVTDQRPIKDLEIEVRNEENKQTFLRISAVPVLTSRKGFSGYRGVARDITVQKLEQERILELATKDHLTGLLNRSAFLLELEKTINISKRNGIKGVLLSIDIDMFKYINDSHGHEAGDRVLYEVGQLLERELRGTDVIGRAAGDEFVVIMHDITNKEARKKIRSLLDALNRLRIDYNGEKIQITCSVGVVRYPSSGQTFNQLLTAAGLAMHKAKDMGRNRIYMIDDSYSEKSNISVKEKMKNLNILRNSLDNDDFEMHFQPMIPMRKGNNVIFESLLRIRDEKGNLGSPVEYVDAAERFGLAPQLDISVLRKCMKHYKYLQKQERECMLSINISGLSLGDENVMNVLKKLVKEEQPDTNKIIIEVTETAAMRDEDKARKFVSHLHDLGFKFALDDFGAGYSSFYYLKNLEVDYIKIDGSFVQNLEHSKEDRVFVKALADLARGLNITIIAEFVENQRHVDILRKLGVDYLQGYYISKPIGSLDDAISKFDEVSIDDI